MQVSIPVLSPKLFAMTFHSSARKTLCIFCFISLLLIKILFLSKQLPKAYYLQVFEKHHSYQKSPFSYCDFPSQRSRLMKSCAQQCRFRESLVHNRIYAAVVLRSRHKNNSLTAPALLEVLTKREKPEASCWKYICFTSQNQEGGSEFKLRLLHDNQSSSLAILLREPSLLKALDRSRMFFFFTGYALGSEGRSLLYLTWKMRVESFFCETSLH